MTRPTKITPDPIIDAVVELRYESNIPADAIFGMLFSQIKSKYSDFKKLPISEFPDEIKKKDPALKFSPYYQATATDAPSTLNIGPQVISLSNTGAYSGWKENYLPSLLDLLKMVNDAGIVKQFLRIGIRYIDFFELDILDGLVKSPGKDFQAQYVVI